MEQSANTGNISHAEMVKTLAKPGEAILKDITPLNAHLLHMAVGISGEVGELLEALTANDVDRANVVEEFGDIEFYMEGVREPLVIIRQTVLNVENEPMTNILCKLTIEAARLLDNAKRAAIYTKPIDKDAIIENLYKIDLYLEQLRVAFDISREETIIGNINKLSERYKNFQYTNQAANARADKAPACGLVVDGTQDCEGCQ